MTVFKIRNKFLCAGKTLLVCVMLMTSVGLVNAQSYTLTFSDVEFDSSTGIITKYINEYNKIITIPSSFLVDGKEVVVKGIGASAFYQRYLTHVELPSTIDSIGSAAFRSNRLKSITIPDGVKTIGSAAFSGNALEDVILSKELEVIEGAAFSRNLLTVVDLPSTVVSIGKYAFEQNLITVLSLPENLTFIGESAFCENKISSLSINDNVTSIEKAAFTNNEIVEVNGSPSDGIIYARFADGTEDFTSIVSYGGASDTIDFIPSKVTHIQDYAFSDCGIKHLVVPSSVISIGIKSFYMNDLVHVDIPNGVKMIGESAFNYNRIETLSLPSSLTHLGALSFNHNAINELNGELSHGLLCAIDEDGTEDRSTLIGYGGADTVINFIPNSVKIIGDRVFHGSNITELFIPLGIEVIGRRAFSSNNIQSVLIPKSVISIGYWAFFNSKIKELTFESGSSLLSIEKQAFILNDFKLLELPQHANPQFSAWVDASNKKVVDSGDGFLITSLGVSYKAIGDNFVAYAPNGGVGEMDSALYLMDEVTLHANEFTKAESKFVGWATSPNGEVVYKDAEVLSLESGLTLYAQWKLLGCRVTIDVTSGDKVVDKARVTFNNILYFTDASGTATIEDVMGDTTYTYSVSAEGYEAISKRSVFLESDTTLKVVMTPTASALESTAEQHVAICPNPTDGMLYITSDKLYQVSLLGLSGKLVRNNSVLTNSLKMDLTGLKAGVYILQLSNADETIVRQVIKH